MFAKNSVFRVSATAVALVGFMSLGALMFPQVAEALCLWNCTLVSNANDDSGTNSPGKYQIRYCFDQDCLLNLTDSDGNHIFNATDVPSFPGVTQVLSNESCFDVDDETHTTKVTVDGTVVAFREDSNGYPIPDSAAEAGFHVVVLGAACDDTGSGTISRIVSVNEDPQAVFGAAPDYDPGSSITIRANPLYIPSLKNPLGWGENGAASCTTYSDGSLKYDCPFPLGVEEWNKQFKIANELPEIFPYQEGEVYFADGSTHFVGLRMCKGDANSTDPSTVRCSAGGIESDALFEFSGNWAGATNHTINPVSGSNPYDIFTDRFASIDPSTVTASANGGPQVATTGCRQLASQTALRCYFVARDLLPDGCTSGQPVDLVVRGQVFVDIDTAVKFVSTDNPICQ
jgi:hypothetical protein